MDFQWLELDDALLAGVGLVRWAVPEEFDGWKLQSCHAQVETASSSGEVSFQIRRRRGISSQYMLSTPLTIDEAEYDSKDAIVAPVIDPTGATIASGDTIFIDCISEGTDTEGAEVSIMIGNY